MSELSVATYNIHRCIGTDGLYQPERIRQVLHQLDSEVITLQEVESGANRGEILDYFCEGSHWQYIEGPALLRADSRYGNAVLTSLPVINHRLIELSYPEREPRGAIDLYLKHNNYIIRVIATHFGLSIRERRFQTGLLEKLLDRPLEENTNLSLLMGDINEWFPWSQNLRKFSDWFGHSLYRASYPTRLPVLALDRIWVKPHETLTNARLYRSDTARVASDHYPLKACISLS